MKNDVCPRLNDWIALLNDSLLESLRLELEDHLEVCERCRNLLSYIAEWPDDLIDYLQIHTQFSPKQLPNENQTQSKVPFIAGYDELVEINRGGMSIIYSARQIDLNRRVAIKLLTTQWPFQINTNSSDFRESRLLAKLNHPNIVKVFSVGVYNDLPYIVMELNDQSDLQTKINECLIAPVEAAKIIQKIASAIHYAHELGVIHRDIKPSNILIDSMGVPKITDFGIAKETDSIDYNTRTGYLLGTPKYMSPEQIDPEIGPKDNRIDIYGLGVTLYTILTGDAPFQSTTENAILRKIVQDDPVPPRKLQKNISRDLDTIILKCLEKKPINRFSNAQELADELQRFLEGRPILSRPVSRKEVMIRKCQRHPVEAGMGLVILFFIFLTVVGSILFGINQKRLRVKSIDLEKLAQNNMRLMLKENEQAQKLMNSLSLNMEKTSKLFMSLNLNTANTEYQRIIKNYLDDVIPIYESYLKNRQKDILWIQDEIVILFILADFYEIRGRFPEATDHRIQAIKQVKQLIKKDNLSDRLRIMTADAATKAIVNQYQGINIDEYYNLAYEVIKNLNAEDSEYKMEAYQRKAMTAYNLAKYRFENGNYLECAQIHSQFISMLETSISKHPDELDLWAYMVQNRCGLTETYLKLGECERADYQISLNDGILNKLPKDRNSKFGPSLDILKNWNEDNKVLRKDCKPMP